MKKSCLILFKYVIICNFLVIYFFCFPMIALAEPSIRFKEIYHDFGELKSDEQVTHFFEFQNSGVDMLKISRVRANCSCITTELLKKDLKPKEKEKICVLYKPSYREGVQEKYIFVHTNDPDFPIIKLTVMAQIKVAAMLEPELLDFSDDNTLKAKKVKFKNKLDVDLTIISIATEKDFIDYEILNDVQTAPVTIKPNQELDILVSLKNSNLKELNNELQSTLTICTDNSDHPDFRVFIRKRD